MDFEAFLKMIPGFWEEELNVARWLASIDTSQTKTKTCEISTEREFFLLWIRYDPIRSSSQGNGDFYLLICVLLPLRNT